MSVENPQELFKRRFVELPETTDEPYVPFRAAYKKIQAELNHSILSLRDEEFADMVQSKTQATFPSLTEENLFPSLKHTKLSLTEDRVYEVFERKRDFENRAHRLDAPPLGGGGMMISSKMSTPKGQLRDEFNHFFLDWLTVTMAQARSRNVTEYAVPQTLYLRPRAESSEEGASSPTAGVSLARGSSVTRTFEWHVLDSHSFPDERMVLLATVMTWESTTSPPFVWGFWTYLRKGEPEGPFRSMIHNEDQYVREKEAVKQKIRGLTFDPQGLFQPEHFTVDCEAYTHLTLGQFIGVMFSAEFQPSPYSPFVLDQLVKKYIQYILPGLSDYGDDSDAVRAMLFGLEPLVRDSKAKESAYAFPILGHLPRISPYEYAITPDRISFEHEKTHMRASRSSSSEDDASPGERAEFEETYRVDELKTLGIPILDPTSSSASLRRAYPETSYYIKDRKPARGAKAADLWKYIKRARDDAIFIKKAHNESERIPDVTGVSGTKLILQNVGTSLESSLFKDPITKARINYADWLKIEENEVTFLKDVEEALRALWRQGYIHGDLGTDIAPKGSQKSRIGAKSAQRNITYDADTNRYHVIDLDLEDMIPKDMPKDPTGDLSIFSLRTIPYDLASYPYLQSMVIYRILTS